MRSLLKGVYVLITIVSFSLRVSAQSNSVPLIELLNSLQQTHNIKFSYNPKLLRDFAAPLVSRSAPLDQTLTTLSQSLPFRFEASGQSAYLIIPVRSDIAFQVIDANDSKPLEIIYVTINKSKQLYLLASESRFTLENTFPTDSIQIRTSFYQPVSVRIDEIKSDSPISLTPETTNLGEVTVMSYLTSGVNSKLSDHSMEVDMSSLGLLSGDTDGDLLQVLQAIPGIRSPNGKPGTINLRGSPFDQNGIYFDDIPIYHTGHFFGTFSPYNPGIVDKITVHRGVLPAQFGGRVGGVIDIKTMQNVPETTSVSGLANTVFGGIEFSTPIVNNRLGLSLSARSSYPFEGLSPKLDAYYDLNFQGSRISTNAIGSVNNLNNLDIGFSDINGKLIYDTGNDGKLSLSLMNIENDFAYELETPNQNRVESEKTELNNWGLNAQWQGRLSERITSSFSFTKSSLEIKEIQLDTDQNGIDQDQIIQNSIEDTRLTANLNYELGASSTFKSGYELTSHDLTITELRNNRDNTGNDLRKSNGSINSIFGSLEHRIGDRFITNLGLRADFFSINNQRFLDPRISMTYVANNNLFFKASGGRAHQYVKQSFNEDFDDFRVSNQFWILTENNIPVMDATQYMVGALYDKASWLFDIEFYSKQIHNISQPGGNQQNPNLFGDLSVIGADLLIKKRWNKLETWASYTLSHTTESIQREQDSYNDQRHVLNLKMIVPMNRWSIAASWGLMSGLPVYLPDPDEIDDEPGQNGPLNISYTGRFPAQHQLDLSATWLFSNPDAKWKGVLGFSVLNLYDRQNVINVFQENTNVNDPIRFGLGFSPNVQIKISF